MRCFVLLMFNARHKIAIHSTPHARVAPLTNTLSTLHKDWRTPTPAKGPSQGRNQRHRMPEQAQGRIRQRVLEQARGRVQHVRGPLRNITISIRIPGKAVVVDLPL